MPQSLEATLAQLAGLNRQVSAEASASLLLAQTRQFIAAGGPVISRSATLVAAASDASAQSKLGADYRCDDYATDDLAIQAAIDALPSGGGKVVLSEGTFTLAAPLSRNIDSVCIEGAGLATRLNLNGSTAVISAGSQSGWVFRNFDTDAGGVDAPSDAILEHFEEGVHAGLDVAGGVARMGAFIMQWGSATSTQDTVESFTFNEDFPTACFMVTTQRFGGGGAYVISVQNITKSGFDSDRTDQIDGSVGFYWFAIGH